MAIAKVAGIIVDVRGFVNVAFIRESVSCLAMMKMQLAIMNGLYSAGGFLALTLVHWGWLVLCAFRLGPWA